MNRIVVTGLFGVAAALLIGPSAGAQDRPLRAVSFSKDVLPIFKASCMKCHSGKETKGGIDLSSYASEKRAARKAPSSSRAIRTRAPW